MTGGLKMGKEGKGYKVAAELVVEDTFGTLDTDTPVTTAFPLLTETLTQTPEWLPNDLKSGSNEAENAPTLARMSPVTGQTTCIVDFHNIEEILKMAVGASSGAGTVASPYIFEPDAEIPASGVSYSLIIDKTKERWQFTGGCIESLTLSGQAGTAGGRVIATIDWIFQKLTRSATALAGAALTASEAVKLSQLVFRIGTQADALDSNDALTIADLSYMIKNNWKAPEYGSGSNFMVAPIREKQREVSLNLTALRYNSDDEITAIQTAAGAGSKLQADMTFTGGTSPRSLVIKLPELLAIEVPNPPVNDATNLIFSPKFRAYKNSSATIMTDVKYETLITLTQTS